MTAICCHRRYAIVKTRQPEVRFRELLNQLLNSSTLLNSLKTTGELEYEWSTYATIKEFSPFPNWLTETLTYTCIVKVDINADPITLQLRTLKWHQKLVLNWLLRRDVEDKSVDRIYMILLHPSYKNKQSRSCQNIGTSVARENKDDFAIRSPHNDCRYINEELFFTNTLTSGPLNS